MTRIKAFDPKPFKVWWIKIFTGTGDMSEGSRNYRIIWLPLVAPDIKQETGERIEGKDCEIRKLAEKFGYRLSNIRASLYVRLNHEPDLDRLRKRIVPINMQEGSSEMSDYIAARLTNFDLGDGI